MQGDQVINSITKPKYFNIERSNCIVFSTLNIPDAHTKSYVLIKTISEALKQSFEKMQCSG